MGKSYKERKNMILKLMGNDLYVPMKEKELAVFLQVMPEDRPVLSSILKELLEEKKIEISKRGKYTLYDPKLHEEEDLITGTFISNHKGFGFVEVEGRDDDLYISKENVNGAFHLDIVEARIISAPSDKRRVEAKIVRVVERGTDQIVGVFQKSPGFGFVIPDDHKLSDDIFIPKEYCNGAVDGHKVVVKLTSYGGDGKKPEGKVIEILGHINDPGVDILSIVKGFGLPTEFPEKVLNQAFAIGDEVSEADMAGREDLRSWQMVTIDGEDMR